MPSDAPSNDSDDTGKGPMSHVTKAVAAVFATVVAPVLVALGVKFTDAIFTPPPAKPPEEAKKSEPEKSVAPAPTTSNASVESAAKSEPEKSSALKNESVVTQLDQPKPAALTDTESSSASTLSSEGAPKRGGKRNRKDASTDRPDVSQTTLASPISLFNGHDPSGWGSTGAEINHWSIAEKGNILVGSTNGKKQGHWLFTDKEFSDFRLRLEFRVEPGTESGIALRTPPVSNVKEGRITIRLTGDADASNPTGSLVTWSGGTAHLQTSPLVSATLRPTKGWNVVEIDFHGPNLKATINGQTVQDVKVDQLAGKSNASLGLMQKTGRIGLECRAGHVEFRKIEIQESTNLHVH